MLAHDDAYRLTADVAQGEHRIDKAGGDEPAGERHVPPGLRLRTGGTADAAPEHDNHDAARWTNRAPRLHNGLW